MIEVHQAIARVMRAIEPVAKSSAPGLKYRALMEADIMAAVRPAMIENGLTVIPVAVDLLDSSVSETRSGTRMQRVAIRVVYRLTHAPSGESVDVATVGEAADNGDKALAKSMTIAWKYCVRQTFAIATGDDPDVKSHEFVSPSVAAPSVVSPPSNGYSDRPLVREVTRLVDALSDPAAAMQSILEKRGIAKLDELGDSKLEELRLKLADRAGVEFFDKSLTGESAKN